MRAVDTAGRLDGQAVHDAGYTLALRYASHDPAKDLTLDEARDLLAAGVDIGLVWETYATRPMEGAQAGREDGAALGARMDALGCPPWMAGYFAVDFDARPPHYPEIGAYRDAFALELGRPDGCYGGAGVLEAMQDRGGRYGWQAGATSWSDDRISPRAQLLQLVEQVVIAGTTCDVNEILYPNYGGWLQSPAPTPGPTPLPVQEDDMPRALPVADPTSQGTWWCRTLDGSIYVDGGAPFLGGVNGHPDWNNPGGPQDPVAGFALWLDQDGAWGYVITTEDDEGLHFYHFDRRGTYAHGPG